MSRVVAGVISGAVGTLVLDGVTYADMVVRGRPASTVPEETIRRTARRLGVPPLAGTARAAENRRQGLGALSGYATGAAVGTLNGLLWPDRRSGVVADALAVGAVAMVVGNAGAVSAGVTDPRRWTMADWLADIVPHLGFGFATVATARAMGRGRR